MRPVAVLVAVFLALAVVACGGGGGKSKQDKAQARVCSARDDIAKHGGNAAKSLAAVSSLDSSFRDQLKDISDSQLQASLAVVSKSRPAEEDRHGTRAEHRYRPG